MLWCEVGKTAGTVAASLFNVSLTKIYANCNFVWMEQFSMKINTIIIVAQMYKFIIIFFSLFFLLNSQTYIQTNIVQ